MKHNKINQQAFSLVELGVVVVIIGLITGGLLTAQVIKRNASILAIMKEVSNYKTSVQNFRDKFGALPGDISNASQLWCSSTCSGATNLTANCLTDSGTAGYCNGNLDGMITMSASLVSDERARAWQHLLLAKMLNGSFSGTHSAASDLIAGVNMPASFYAGQVYYLNSCAMYDSANAGCVQSVAVNLVGYVSGVVTYSITAKDASAIDQKMDDSIPKTGLVRAYPSDDAAGFYGTGSAAGTGCVTGATNVYNFSSTAGGCGMQFIFNF